ncbi:MAG: hypothetical protein AB7G11_09215 [Phycisphaerales bacterium]
MNSKHPNPSEPATPASDTPAPAMCPLRRWGRRLGIAGFCFFLFKGLLWLIIPAWIVMERGCAGQ